jgi:hypothetical protein
MLTLNILIKYEKITNPSESDENVLTICLQAEQTKATLEDYRQKLYYIQRLDFEACQNMMPSSQYKDVRGFSRVFDSLESFKNKINPI